MVVIPASRKNRAAATASSRENGRTSAPVTSSRPRTVRTRSAGTIRGGLTQK
jgi:hypothetical protein